METSTHEKSLRSRVSARLSWGVGGGGGGGKLECGGGEVRSGNCNALGKHTMASRDGNKKKNKPHGYEGSVFLMTCNQLHT